MRQAKKTYLFANFSNEWVGKKVYKNELKIFEDETTIDTLTEQMLKKGFKL